MAILGRSFFIWLALAITCAGSAQAQPSLYTSGETWVDEDGQQVRLAQWRGKPTIIAMEYSACRFICSVYWRRLQQIQREADRRGLDLQFVILSIDPEHDSPAGWREYRKARDLSRRNWHFLTTSRPTTTRVAALLGVRWWYDEDHLMHDFKVVRVDAEGRIAGAVTTYDESIESLLAQP